MTTAKKPELCIIGSGGHSRPILDTAGLLGWKIRGLLDLNWQDKQESILGAPVLGGLELLDQNWARKCRWHVAVGDNDLREELSLKLAALGLETVTLIHPAAVVSPAATIGQGSFINAAAVLSAEARLGQACILNTAAVVDHESSVGDFSHLAPRAALAGRTELGHHCFAGMASTVIDDICIANHVTIGAGAVVIRPCRVSCKLIGVPAVEYR